MGGLSILFLGALGIGLVAISWWRDLLREADIGHHTRFIIKGYRDGIAMFIFSEVILFFSLFWRFFHSCLRISRELGQRWPPPGIRSPKPLATVGFNTILLLRRGAFVTYAHKRLKLRDYHQGPLVGIGLSIICGVLFLYFQAREYYWNRFTIADRVYGSTFYIITGFHGGHVIVGTAWLTITFFRLWLGHFTRHNHFGLRACLWYWHFVDVVWLVVWALIYGWWGGHLFKWWFTIWDGKIYTFSYSQAKPSWYMYLQEEHKPNWYAVPWKFDSVPNKS